MANSETGRVVGVQEDVAGTVLTVDATGNPTTLHVENTAVFDEEGGSLRVIGVNGQQVVSYTAVDDDALTLTITPALDADLLEGEEVRLEPLSIERYAMVGLEDAAEYPILARIPHHLIRRMPPGTRDETDREAVVVQESDAGDWTVTDLLARGSARPGYGETDWTNENGVSLVKGDAGSNVPFAILGTATILPIFYAARSSENHHVIPSTGLQKMGEGGEGTDAMVIQVTEPTILYADANAYCLNEHSTDWNMNFYVGATINGNDTNGSPYQTATVADDYNVSLGRNRMRGLTCLRRIYVDPAGVPTLVHLWWGFRAGGGSPRNVRIGGMKMRVIASYAPDANPDGSTIPAWTDDVDTIARYQTSELDA